MTIEDFPSKETAGDNLHRAARIGLSFIPVAGDAAVELMNLIMSPPLENRRNKWFSDLAEKIKQLEEAAKISAQELQQSEQFVTIVMHATQAAMRSHETEKLEALRNAALNAATDCSIDESLQQMFIHLIDEFTPWHIRILKLFQDPLAWFNSRGIQPPQNMLTSSRQLVIDTAFPNHARKPAFAAILKMVIQDFDRLGFGASNLTTMMTPQGALSPCITELGNTFIRYITEPPMQKPTP